jgi:4-hydroxybenzoate polyprenyltransferase
MAGVARKVLSAVEMTRASMAFGAITDLWLIVILSRTRPEYHYMPAATMPLAQALACSALTAIGLFAFGATLNDLLDARRDRVLSRQRPLAAGDLGGTQALTVALGSLLLAIAGSVLFGSGALLITLLVAGGLVFYNGLGKYIPGVGIMTIGLLHAIHMLIPNDQFTFTLPAWLAMTHALVVAVALHILQGKRPLLSRRAIAAVAAGWIAWSIVIIGLGVMRSTGPFWPSDAPIWGMLLPIFAAAGFGAVLLRKIPRAITPHIAAAKVARYGALWQSVYAAAWLFAWGQFGWGLVALILAAAAFGLTIALKEVSNALHDPLGFRG